jgi:hypothetical protein
VVNIVIAALAPTPKGYYTGAVASFYFVLLAAGAVSLTRGLPFVMMLGVSRRSYYLGTTALAMLPVVEGATGGWGNTVHFFRVPWLLQGP